MGRRGHRWSSLAEAMAWDPDPYGVGVVYLLHFDPPYRSVSRGRKKTAGHYLGWTRDLPARLAAHEAGRGGRLVEVAVEAGCVVSLSRVWTYSTPDDERQLKDRKRARLLCPRCDPNAMRRATTIGYGRTQAVP